MRYLFVDKWVLIYFILLKNFLPSKTGNASLIAEKLREDENSLRSKSKNVNVNDL